MPAFATVSLSDTQATPVVHYYVPSRIITNGDKVIASWEDRSAGLVVGYNRLRHEVSARNKNGMFKQRVILERATLETLNSAAASGINPAPTLAYTTVGVFELWAHERSLANERSDVIKALSSILGATAWSGAGTMPTAIVNMEPQY